MLKMRISPTPLIWALMAVVGLAQTSCVNTTNSFQPFEKNSGNGMDDKFVRGINIKETSVYGDKHIRTTRRSSNIPSLAPTVAAAASTPAIVTGERQMEAVRPIPENNVGTSHNDVLYEINKSNQEHTQSHNRLTSTALGGEFADSSSSASSFFERVEWQESQTPAGNQDKLLLHRHKRYLLFPEGSSFQLVFDLIIPIVDYTNFAIMGITCAVAWELPSKPPSEIIDNFRNKLNDGTLGFSRRNDSVQQRPQYIKDKEAFNTVDDEWENNSQISSAAAPASVLQQTPPRNSYYANTLHRPQTTNMYYQQPERENQPGEFSYNVGSTVWPMNQNSNKLSSQSRHETNPSAAWQNDRWWEQNKNRVRTHWQQTPWKWPQSPSSHQRTGRNHKKLSNMPKHRIYPVFGKRRRRSIHNPTSLDNDDLTHELNEIHIKQHLDTRHTLYAKIEKLYKTRGHNGTACVLRNVCETHKLQRKRNQPPNTFVMELLRAIFSLPSDALATKSMDTPYIAAMLHAHNIQSCSHHYDGCAVPVWHNVHI